MDGDQHNAHADQMSADRLLRAADVLMAARGRGDDSEAFVDAWLGNADDVDAPAERPFTYDELVEGMCFLIRCGFVDPTVRTGARVERRKPRSH